MMLKFVETGTIVVTGVLDITEAAESVEVTAFVIADGDVIVASVCGVVTVATIGGVGRPVTVV